MRHFQRPDDEVSSPERRLKFLNSMVHFVSSPMRFDRLVKNGPTAHRYILIHFDKLFYKERPGDANRDTRAFKLKQISKIDIDGSRLGIINNGKGSGKGKKLDLSADKEKHSIRWKIYLDAYVRHYKRVANEVMMKCN